MAKLLSQKNFMRLERKAKKHKIFETDQLFLTVVDAIKHNIFRNLRPLKV